MSIISIHFKISVQMSKLRFFLSQSHIGWDSGFSSQIGRMRERLGWLDIGGFHAISGDTNNNGEMNKCWWTNKAS